MVFIVDPDAPARFQSERTSVSKSQNCGVTVIAAIADYYTDTSHSIETGRRLIEGTGPYVLGRDEEGNLIIVVGAPRDTPTTARQQAEMLRRWGVECAVARFRNTDQLHAIVDSGRRPVLLALKFSTVPKDVAGHAFRDWHAIKVRSGVTKSGRRGFLVNDPNFWPGRPDPDKGLRFYSDAVVQKAIDAVDGTVGVVPLAAKPDPTFTETDEMTVLSRIKPVAPRMFAVRKGVELRRGPGTEFPLHFLLPANDRFKLIGWDIDPATRKKTGWVVAARAGGTGVFFVPPDHGLPEA
jgi:hypothetical protein